MTIFKKRRALSSVMQYYLKELKNKTKTTRVKIKYLKAEFQQNIRDKHTEN